MPLPQDPERDPGGWQSLLVRRCPEPALVEELDADVVVVGAGFTGIAAARAWAECRPDHRVALLEAGVVGDTAAGRGAGLLLAADPNESANAAAPPGVASERQRLIAGTVADLERLVEAHDIRCQWTRGGVYRVAVSDHGRQRLSRLHGHLRAAGVDCETLDAAALARRLGSRYYRAGLYTPACALVQPAALIRGLADCLPLSVTLFEESPATTLTREADGWRVQGRHGSVKAPTVLLANDFAAVTLAAGHGPAGPRLALRHACSALTPPLPRQLLARLGADPAWAVLPAGERGTMLRRVPGGRLLVRAWFAHDAAVDRSRRLRAALVRRYPNLPFAGVAFDHVWSGAAGFSSNGAPLWGERAPGLWLAAAGNGSAAVTGTLFGTLLAHRAMGRDSVDLAALFGTPGRLLRNPLRQLRRVVRATLSDPAARRRAP